MAQHKSQLASDSIFWVEVDKITPNPYQPRREFDPEALQALSDSIRQYGVLQPLVVTRKEVSKSDGGIAVEYELVAGERRLRASKLAGVAQVPVVIRTGEDDSLMKLELAIIENLQREDLNPVDRAKAFQQFIDEFGYKHAQIAKKVGKSREYVSNSLRLLSLPEEILDALVEGKITEGHARPLMMLRDKPEEQMTLFKEVMLKKLTVRDAEKIARRNAQDKIRKKSRDFDPEILKMEKQLTEQLGTRVHIEPREVGGKITIDFFSDDDLKSILSLINAAEEEETENQKVPSQKEEEEKEDGMLSVLEKLEMKREIRENEKYKEHTIPGTVAFSGAQPRKEKTVEEREGSLGDVLKQVLKPSSDEPPKKQSTFASKVMDSVVEPKRVEQESQEPKEESQKEPKQPEYSHIQQTEEEKETPPPTRTHEDMQKMHEAVFEEETEEKKEEQEITEEEKDVFDDIFDFDLPDTGSLRSEVNSLLSQSTAEGSDSHVDAVQQTLERKNLPNT